MTKVIQVDCDKIKKWIGITLWALATFGMTYGALIEAHDIYYNGWQLNYGDDKDKCCDISVALPVVLLWIVTFFNDWIVIACFNEKYKWIKFECVSKKTEEHRGSL